MMAIKDQRGEIAYLFGTMEEVTEEMRRQKLHERRRAILEAMAYSAEDLLRSPETELLFPRLLTRLGKAAEVSHAFVFDKFETREEIFVTLRHEWTAEEGATSLREKPLLQGLPLKEKGLSRWIEAFSRGGMIVGDVEAFPPGEREFLQALGFRSLLAIPVMVGGKWVGFLGLGEATSSRSWTSDEINALRAAAGLISAAVERKTMEESLKREREMLLETLKDAPYGVLLVEGERHIFANEEFTKITGYTLQDVPTVKGWIRKAFPERAIRRRLKGTWTLEAAMRREVVELPVTAKDGAKKWVEFRSSYLPSGQVMVTLVDVTQEREMERQLRTAQRLEALGELAGGIAHDFNNLLTTIRSFAQIGLSKTAQDNPLRRYLEVIERESQRGAELTRKILAYARRQPLALQLLDLNTALSEILEILKRTLGEHIRIKTALAPELEPIEADPTALEQILMNLAINARDAMPKGGTLTIKTYRRTVRWRSPWVSPGEYAVLEVGDTGVGMDEETLSRIFDPFFTTKERGSGLGLWVVYGLVKQHRGTITVQSERDRGTTFHMYFPIAKEAERKPSKPEAQAQGMAKGTGTILVVEDEPSLRELLREVLKEHGYRPLLAKDGKEGLRILREREGTVDLVVTDIVMPKMGGKELFEEAKDLYPHLPFLFISGYAPPEEVQSFIAERDLPFMVKPFGPLEFLSKVREILSLRVDKRPQRG